MGTSVSDLAGKTLTDMRFIVITGPSGAGKTLALHSFEDAGYYTVDNLPPRLLPALIDFCRAEGHNRGAVVIDIRSGRAFDELPEALDRLRAAQCNIETLFLDASDDALIHRFKETRRPHPLYTEPMAGIAESGILDAIHAERSLLHAIRGQADQIIDTSALGATQLRHMLHTTYAPDSRPGLLVTVISFGFKHGLPVDADLVFDVRFLDNPHYVPELRGLDGRDAPVADYVHRDPLTQPFAAKMIDLIAFALPQYQREGKAYLNIAIGCTGGKHRSVVLSEDLAARLRTDGYRVALRHRDIATHHRVTTQQARPAEPNAAGARFEVETGSQP
jgi:RNase adapter protein RapZ